MKADSSQAENALESKILRRGFGVNSVPNLIVCRENALLKTNGQPYSSSLDDGWWPLVVSNGENPLRLLIELLWTKLSNQFGVALPTDDTLQMERISPFLSAHFARFGDQIGWQYRLHSLTRVQLAQSEPRSWEPDRPNHHELTLWMQVAREGEFDVRSKGFLEYAAKEGFDAKTLVAGLVARRVLAWCDSRTVRLIDTEPHVISLLADGRMLLTSETDMVPLWLEQNI